MSPFTIRIRSVLILSGLLFPAPGFGQSQEEKQHETVKIQVPDVPDDGPRPDLEQVSKSIIEGTNAFRKKEGREPVAVNEKLRATAQAFAEFMAKTDTYGHTADGKRPAARAEAHEYDYCIVSENIAYAFDSSGFTAEALTDKFVTGWKNSPEHRKNMLNPDVIETGVAVARSEKTGYYYAVQMFGRPASAAIEFQIENRTKESITYTLGKKSFHLEPRVTRTHTLCRPAEMTFQWPGEKREPTVVKPATKDHYLVTRSGDTFHVQKK